jgi:hypothetical protein
MANNNETTLYNPEGQDCLQRFILADSNWQWRYSIRTLQLKTLYVEVRSNNAAGCALLNHYKENECLIAGRHIPTHIADGNPAGADVLDFAVLNNSVSSCSQNISLFHLGKRHLVLKYEARSNKMDLNDIFLQSANIFEVRYTMIIPNC